MEEILKKQWRATLKESVKYVKAYASAMRGLARVAKLVSAAAQLDAEITGAIYESLSPAEKKEYAKERLMALEWKVTTWKKRL